MEEEDGDGDVGGWMGGLWEKGVGGVSFVLIDQGM